MWFKMNRRKVGGVGRQANTPLKAVTKSKKFAKRFRWPTMRRASVRDRKPATTVTPNVGPAAVPLRRTSPGRAFAALPSLSTSTNGVAWTPPRRIRCGTTIIPIMRESATRLPPPITLKRRQGTSPSMELSLDHPQQKVPRLSRPVLEHFNPIYDDVYSDFPEESEDEAIYEEIEPPRKRALVSITPLPTASYLDLMQVSAVLNDSPVERLRCNSSTPLQDAYALHGGDWVSIASGIYDEVASASSDSESEEFDNDAGIYGWSSNIEDAAQDIPWRTAAYGESTFVSGSSALRRLYRESFVIQ